jgi:hypothetical protein
MQNPKQESKILAEIEKIYLDADGAARANRARTLVFSIAGVASMGLGMYLSKSGVIQGLCDILVCLSGVFLAYAFLHFYMNQTNPLLRKYTQLDQEKLRERISTLKK